MFFWGMESMNRTALLTLVACAVGCGSTGEGAFEAGSSRQALTTIGTIPVPVGISTITIQPRVPRVLIARVGTDGVTACIDISGRQGRWAATRLDGWNANVTPTPPSTVLSPFCVFEWKAATGTTGVPESGVLPQAVVTNVTRYADAPVVAPNADWLATSSTWTKLRDAAVAAAALPALSRPAVPSYVGVIDSSPDDFASCEGTPGRYDHGEAIARYIRVVTGSDGRPCGAGISVHTALALPRDATGAVNALGGSYGYVSDVALAVSRTLRSWSTLPRITVIPRGGQAAFTLPPPRVLNLSLAWDDASRSIGQNARDAMRAVLNVASCSGVVTLAAAGNTAGGASERLLAPAAWQDTDAAPDAATCSRYGFARVNVAAPTTNSRLVYAVGALDGSDAPVFNARSLGMPRLAAYGDEVVMARRPGLATAYTQPKTGSSMGTALAAAVTASAWTYSPDAEAGALMDRVYTSSTKLSTRSKTVAATACGPFTSGCTVARVDLCKVLSAFSGITTGCVPKAPFAGTRVSPGVMPAAMAWSVGVAAAGVVSATGLKDTTPLAPAVRPMPGSSTCGLCGMKSSTAYLSLANPAATATINVTSTTNVTKSYAVTLGAGTAYSVALPVALDTKSATVTFTGLSSGVTWSATDSILFF